MATYKMRGTEYKFEAPRDSDAVSRLEWVVRNGNPTYKKLAIAALNAGKDAAGTITVTLNPPADWADEFDGYELPEVRLQVTASGMTHQYEEPVTAPKIVTPMDALVYNSKVIFAAKDGKTSKERALEFIAANGGEKTNQRNTWKMAGLTGNLVQTEEVAKGTMIINLGF